LINCPRNTSLTGISIPPTVVTISESALQYCRNLTTVTVPASVTTIGANAFQYCSGIENLTFAPNSQLQQIGNNAFSGCSALTAIDIPVGVTAIPNGAFTNCSNLVDVTIPANVTSIGGSVFQGCSNLETLIIPAKVTSLGSQLCLNATKLVDVTCLPVTPPTLSNTTQFNNTHADLKIKVPAESLELYKTTTGGWSQHAAKFIPIEE